MKRTAIFTLWLVSVSLAYLAGRQTEQWLGMAADSEQKSVELQQLPPPSAVAEPRHRDHNQDKGADLSDRVARARQLSESGELEKARQVLEEYLLIEAHDSTALLLLSDLFRRTGRLDHALVPLFEIIRYPLVPEDAVNARRRLEELITMREQRLVNTGDSAGLVSFFEYLVAAEPAYDGHRLKLSRWLLRSGEVEAAAAVLKEVGFSGVSDAQISALRREIELARARLPVERVDGALHMTASIRGQGPRAEYRLLVDTGASMTGLRTSVLEALRATPLQETRRVHTANGTITLPVFRVSEMAVGGVTLDDLDVLGLADLPPSVDGLLGLDVLDRLPGQAPGVVGMPGNPR